MQRRSSFIGVSCGQRQLVWLLVLVFSWRMAAAQAQQAPKTDPLEGKDVCISSSLVPAVWEGEMLGGKNDGVERVREPVVGFDCNRCRQKFVLFGRHPEKDFHGRLDLVRSGVQIHLPTHGFGNLPSLAWLSSFLSVLAASSSCPLLWGTKASSSEWNISGELCSGKASDKSNWNDSDINPFIKCDCSFTNNTVCHITKLYVYTVTS
ncbi:hypothetical protein ABZP36_029600 [Zizania latifolia]